MTVTGPFTIRFINAGISFLVVTSRCDRIFPAVLILRLRFLDFLVEYFERFTGILY